MDPPATESSALSTNATFQRQEFEGGSQAPDSHQRNSYHYQPEETNTRDNADVDVIQLTQTNTETLDSISRLPSSPSAGRKEAWARSVPAMPAFPNIFDFVPLPELMVDLDDAPTVEDLRSNLETVDVLVNDTASAKPADIDQPSHSPLSRTIDALEEHVNLPIIQALQEEKTLVVPDDYIELGWLDIYHLGLYLAYQVMLLRRNTSSRSLVLDEDSSTDAAAFRPVTATTCAVFASAGIPFNQSTEELVVRQASPVQKAKPKQVQDVKKKNKKKRSALPKKKYTVRPVMRTSNSTSRSTSTVNPNFVSRSMSVLTSPTSQQKIGSVGAIAIFRALRVNTHLLSLTLENAGITDLAMGALGAMIRVNCTLIELSLHQNHITHLGIGVLCEALEDSPDSTLLRLNLGRNRITDAGIPRLCRALAENETLTWLDISWNQISSKGLLSLLGSMKENFALRDLSLFGKDIDEDQYCLNLEAKYAGDIATALRHVNASVANIWLSGQKAMIPVDKIKNSRWIVLPSRDLVELDALVISGLIPLNTQLLTLDLSHNHGIERWAILEILKSIKHCKTLKHVNLVNTGLYEEVGEQVGDLVASNCTLETIVMHEHQLNVQQWRGKDPVETLQIIVDRAHHFDLWILAKCLALNRATQELNQLRLPQASPPLITGAASKKVSINFSLRKLEVFEVIFLARKVFYHLHVGRVALNGCGINSSGGVALADGVRNHASLEVLEVENNQIGEAGGRAMGECVTYNGSISHLNLSWNKIGNEGIRGFETALRANKSLLRLDLRGNALSAAGIMALAGGLKGNACLQELFLRWNVICSTGAEALAEALTQNKTLRVLDIEHHIMGARGAVAFANMLRKNTHLQDLNMKGDDSISDGDASGVGNEAAVQLALALVEKNRSLTNFNIAQNQIGREGIAAFSELVKFTKTLKVLDLSIGEMDGKIADRFFECLSMNKSVVKLNLAHNRISNEGMMACLRMLDVNRVLQDLNIAHNAITEEPIALLAAKWQKKKQQPPFKGYALPTAAAATPALAPLTLQWLCLIGNSMTEKTRHALLALAPMVDIELDEELHRGR